MYVLVDQVGLGSRIILDRGWMAKIGVGEIGVGEIGVGEIGTQVVEVEIEGGALVIRSVPPEERAAALASAETARNERECSRDEAIRAQMPRPTAVLPTRKVGPEEV